MIRKIETDDLKAEFEIEPNGLKLEVEIKDHKVFPELDSEDPVKMSRFAKGMVDGLFPWLSDTRFHKNGDVKKRNVKAKCAKCGKPFDIDVPCCNKKETTQRCPHCGTNNRIPL